MLHPFFESSLLTIFRFSPPNGSFPRSLPLLIMTLYRDLWMFTMDGDLPTILKCESLCFPPTVHFSPSSSSSWHSSLWQTFFLPLSIHTLRLFLSFYVDLASNAGAEDSPFFMMLNRFRTFFIHSQDVRLMTSVPPNPIFPSAPILKPRRSVFSVEEFSRLPPGRFFFSLSEVRHPFFCSFFLPFTNYPTLPRLDAT